MNKIYSQESNLIKVTDTSNFVPEHILDCGQVFRYEKTGDLYKIISNNRFCTLINDKDCAIINCKDVDYFVRYFDLDRDYGSIADALTEKGLGKEVEFGRGIRILRQDPFEMIISFIISANNHIPRIKAIIERICREAGQNMGEYFAFPTPEELATLSTDRLRELGAGYRAEYIADTARRIRDSEDFSKWGDLSDTELKGRLMELKGVGSKVADCIMLFGYGRYSFFPVDTWIVKAFGRQKSEAKRLETELEAKYGELSGFAQQYIYYYNREIAE